MFIKFESSYCLGFCLWIQIMLFSPVVGEGRAWRRRYFYSLWIECCYYYYYYLFTIFFTYHVFTRHNFRRSHIGNKGISLKSVADQKQNPEKLLRRVWTYVSSNPNIMKMVCWGNLERGSGTYQGSLEAICGNPEAFRK